MITLVAGARPNFVKIAPIIRELQKRGVPFRWIHTGQHLGNNMDPWHELEMPEPDLLSNVSGGSHARQTAGVMQLVEIDLQQHRPDWLVVVGDVNSTLGAALAAVKLGVKIAHVEAGYRSYDWTMPEEANRCLVDRMSDLLLCPDSHAEFLVYDEGRTRPVLVGNVMMDSLRWALARLEDRANNIKVVSDVDIAYSGKPYAVLTVHRPANVDTGTDWDRVYGMVERATSLPIVWPIHPRVSKDWRMPANVQRVDPLGYLNMVALLRDSVLVITDSGGVYEEALYLGKEIVSLRDPNHFERGHLTSVPEIWKSDAAPRIVDALLH